MPLGNRVAWSLPCWDLYVCVPWYARVITDFKKGKTHWKSRHNTTLEQGSLFNLPCAQVCPDVLKDGSPATPTGWENLILCQFPVAALSSKSSERRVVWPPASGCGLSPWWQCVCTMAYPAGPWSSSSSLFQQPPLWAQETTPRRWLGLEVVLNFVTDDKCVLWE